jgi:outer membrane protein assembly factor BamB
MNDNNVNVNVNAKAPANEKPRGARWWPAIGIVMLAAANLYRLHSSEDLESNFKNMQTFLTIGVGILLLLLWVLFLSRLRWRARLACLAMVVALGILASQTIRFDGAVNGTGRPRLAWAWTPKRDGRVVEVKPLAAETSSPVETATIEYAEFLGRDRRGTVDVQLDRDWTNHPPKELWRKQVGLGWSGFTVAGTNAYTQEQRGEYELVVCYDLGTGRQNWAHTNHVRFSEALSGDGPRATPTIMDGRVYAEGGTGILDCLDAASGKLLWSRDTLKENHLPNIVFGKSTSPLVFDDLVVVSGGDTNRATLLAYHREDGKPAWQEGYDKASYASPMLATFGGKRQILSLNATSLSGHDLSDGHVLWRYDWGTDQWPKCTQPVLLPGDKVLIAGSFGLGCVLLQVLNGNGEMFSVAEVWKSRSMKSEYSTLAAIGGYLYGLDDGILACVDLATGERKWKDGRYGHGQVVLAGSVLLVQTGRGGDGGRDPGGVERTRPNRGPQGQDLEHPGAGWRVFVVEKRLRSSVLQAAVEEG